jgi:hypothetical protein
MGAEMTDPFGRFKVKCWQADNHGMTALQYRLHFTVPAWFFYGSNVNPDVRTKQMPYLYGDS